MSRKPHNYRVHLQILDDRVWPMTERPLRPNWTYASRTSSPSIASFARILAVVCMLATQSSAYSQISYPPPISWLVGFIYASPQFKTAVSACNWACQLYGPGYSIFECGGYNYTGQLSPPPVSTYTPGYLLCSMAGGAGLGGSISGLFDRMNCPYGGTLTYMGATTGWLCVLPNTFVLTVPVPALACSGSFEGNPCELSTGAKLQTETDLSMPALGGFHLTRTYNSLQNAVWVDGLSAHMNASANSNPPLPPGSQRSSPYDTPADACTMGWAEIGSKVWAGSLAGASAVYLGSNVCQIQSYGTAVADFSIASLNNLVFQFLPPTNTLQTVTLASGARYTFQLVNGVWTETFSRDVKLGDTGSGFVFTAPDNKLLNFAYNGKLMTVTSLTGQSLSLNYTLSYTMGGDDNPDTLDQVMDNFGRILSYSYDGTRT